MTGVGLCLPQLGADLDRGMLREFCEKAESMGFAGLWVQEHMLVPTDPATGYAGVTGLPIPDAYKSVLSPLELLSFAAAWTSTVTIGTSILVGGYHRPVDLAQRLATLDVLSGGRLVVGLGVGWSAEEHEQMGTEMRVRGRRMDDLVRALQACWGPDPVSYDGEFFTIPECFLGPKPIQRPHPPLMSGMWSPPGLDRTARLFDGWNPTALPPDAVTGMVATMQASRPAGMEPLRVWHRVFYQAPLSPAVDVETVIADVRAAAGHGFEEIIIDANFNDVVRDPKQWLDVLDQLQPTLAAAEAS